jgi:putative membrane protein insertion efficiency factor
MTRSPLAWLLSVPVWIYRKGISPMKPPTCRFDPTCSSYALEALKVHGALRGSWLTARRLCRCHPFCEPGFDPVPPRRGGGDAPPHEAEQT